MHTQKGGGSQPQPQPQNRPVAAKLTSLPILSKRVGISFERDARESFLSFSLSPDASRPSSASSSEEEDASLELRSSEVALEDDDIGGSPPEGEDVDDEEPEVDTPTAPEDEGEESDVAAEAGAAPGVEEGPEEEADDLKRLAGGAATGVTGARGSGRRSRRKASRIVARARGFGQFEPMLSSKS